MQEIEEENIRPTVDRNISKPRNNSRDMTGGSRLWFQILDILYLIPQAARDKQGHQEGEPKNYR